VETGPILRGAKQILAPPPYEPSKPPLFSETLRSKGKFRRSICNQSVELCVVVLCWCLLHSAYCTAVQWRFFFGGGEARWLNLALTPIFALNPLVTVRRNAHIASAVLATAIPSVHLSHAGIVSKRRHIAR